MILLLHSALWGIVAQHQATHFQTKNGHEIRFMSVVFFAQYEAAHF